MKHFKILFLTGVVMLILVANLFSQGPDTLWTRTYGGEHDDCAYSIQETSDGGYIIAGWTRSFGAGNSDVYLIKTYANGDTMWTKTYGGEYDDVGYSVQETSDGGFIVAGYIGSSVYLIKTDSNGNLLWSEWYGGSDYDYGYSVQETSDNGYIIAGRISSFSAGGFDVYLIKTDSLGNTLWSKIYGGICWDAGHSVKETSDGGYIIAGCTMLDGEGWDVYLIKTYADGDTIWTKTYGGANWDVGYSVQETSDGGYIVAGLTESFGAGSFDIYLLKIDSLGNTLWTRTHGDVG
ncbi:hypothetical protein KAU34_08080, partial [candidate division WOR-3 bacterium]|nr:hypothetical protein [candidate division WOR-3 bacterium]